MEDSGEHELKGLTDRRHLYRVMGGQLWRVDKGHAPRHIVSIRHLGDRRISEEAVEVRAVGLKDAAGERPGAVASDLTPGIPE